MMIREGDCMLGSRFLRVGVFWVLAGLLVAPGRVLGVESLAVVGFSGYEEAVQVLSRYLAESGRYRLVESQSVAGDCWSKECLAKMAAELGVDCLLVGEVKMRPAGDYILGLKLYSRVLDGFEAEVGVPCDCSRREVLGRLLGLLQELLGKAAVRGCVLAVEGKRVRVDLGEDVGLEAGRRLKVVRFKDVMLNGRKLYTGKTLVGDVRVLEVEEAEAWGKLIRIYFPVREGDVVEVRGLPVLPPSGELLAQVAEGMAEEGEAAAPDKPEPAVEETEAAEKAETGGEGREVVESEPQETPANGILRIKVYPEDAVVKLDGEELGKGSKVVPDILPGRHKIEVMRRSFRSWSGEVKIDAGEEKTVTIRLEKYAGVLVVRSVPGGARVYVDGEVLGRTEARLELPPGRYKVVLEKKGYRKVGRRVKVEKDKTSVVEVVLPKKGQAAIPGMVYVPEGEFIMGSKHGDPDEQPQHKVFLAGFYIDKYEVSNLEYKKFLEATGRRAPNFWTDPDLSADDQPVVGVTWEDARAYCEWAGKRLPTEAEWEKAARGIDGRVYPWGNEFSPQKANAYGKADGFQYTAPVTAFAAGASPFGALNMAGNVAEWCADYYDSEYYSRSPTRNPSGPAEGLYRVIRGGAWDDAPEKLRASNRYADRPSYSAYNLGFRCAK